jgi:hypothetical protein
MHTVVRAVRRCCVPVRVLVAGSLACAAARELADLQCAEYLGRLSYEEALALYAKAHLVYTYYDPAFEIDRLAASGKWADCSLMRVPFVVNSEVETARMYRDAGACYSTAYEDAEGLSALMEKVSSDWAEWEAVRSRLSEFNVEFWDEGIAGAFRAAGLEVPVRAQVP